MSGTQPAILVLADGSVFRGLSLGAEGTTSGEVVFNTALTGYQEILTDPSYSRQIVTLTYPHIGNTGVNAEDVEADRIHAAGLVVRDVPRLHSNFRAGQSLKAYLTAQNIVAIADIDTRRLTRILREKGAQNGCIMAGKVDEARALELARAFPDLTGPRVYDDHTPFQAAGVPSIDLIDFDYPYFHTAGDTLDKVSAASLDQVGETLVGFIDRLRNETC